MRGLPEEPNTQILRDTVLRTFWLFQLWVAGPIAGALGVAAFVRLLEVHGPVYDFVTSLFTAIIASGIVFIVVVQRRTFEQGLPIDLTLKFEVGKSGLATALWIWEMVDSGVQPTSVWNQRGPRMVAAGVSAVVLFLLFYPTVFYVAKERQRKKTAACKCLASDSPEYAALTVV